jgi:hypothetical protein
LSKKILRVKPEDCNLDTDNLTIIWYHNYSGGKFMANCLSLSDHGLFGHKEMTEAQLRGEFSPDDKLNYLTGELSKINKGDFWNDLLITDNKFFGFAKKDYINPWRGITYHKYVKDVSYGDYKFFIASHFNPEVIEIKKIWKNANIILFTHPHDYVEKRASKDRKISVFYERLADYEENLKEMRSLPNVVYEFDVRKYESETETLDAIKEMYDILGIKGYDREKLATYYNDWYNKINEIAIN